MAKRAPQDVCAVFRRKPSGYVPVLHTWSGTKSNVLAGGKKAIPGIYGERIRRTMNPTFANPGVADMLRHVAGKAVSLLYETNDAFWFERNLYYPVAAVRPAIDVDIDMDAGEKTISWIKTSGERWMFNANESRTAGKARHYFPSVA